ncbi:MULTISPECIES: DUF979 domain-containing protein [Clostridium]|uniref:DUF979 domain-containing protein n=1 Tax=Clostridium TaxID=1485 RepID=UPI002910B97B|nr:DUF979 domain-containing protein [Clostridium sp.]
MSFFMDPNITLSAKLLECVYITMGILCLYAGIKAFLKDKKEGLGTLIFWGIMGITFILGKLIPTKITGILVIIMCIPAILKRVKGSDVPSPTKAYSDKSFNKIGFKLFVPAFCGGIGSLLFAKYTKISSLVGLTVGVLLGIFMLMVFNKENKPKVFLEDNRRFLGIVGPLSSLPMLLACLGAVFTKAGVGEAVAQIVGGIIPEGNVTIGIIVYAVGMMLFTMIMGNAFAAITVLTVGVGAPFVFAFGADPVLICSVALTCGFCGTLITPMAANFNIVPVAVLEIKDKNGVIKSQAAMALIMLVFQICYMIAFK